MATIDNPQARPCEAIVTFSDPDFLPVRFGFQALKCPGLQQAEFAMPVEAPNGGASILWFVE
ncbi:MAG: hypothetical protein M1839_005510 [Geoglossum umbratile]|nr:MAG: hypothetical protein M1839_005510 [Geoglossum umbratile]